MRLAGTLPDERLARRFADYLLTLGIESRTEESSGAWNLWIYDEGRLQQAVQGLAAFREQPDDPRYAATDAAEAIRQEKVTAEREFRKNYVDLRRRWDPLAISNRSVTFVLLAVSAAVAVMTSFGEVPSRVTNALLFAPIVVRDDSIAWNRLESIQHGQVWRLVTPIFIHFGVMHLLFNCLMMAQLGGAIEGRWGAWWMLLLVLVLAIPSNLAQYYDTGPLFGGLSGVVYGLLGYAWMKSRYDPQSGIYIPPGTFFWAVAWYVLCFSGAVGHVANMAHTVGLVLGLAFGYAPRLWRQWKR